MSRPVRYMVRMTWSRETLWASCSLSAMREACTALAAPMALRSMQGICTRPPMGSQVMPRLCSMAISAACSTCPLLPPSAAVSPPAAMEQATPTSPWQPTSAPLMEAFSLYRMPMAAEVRKKRSRPSWSAARAAAHIQAAGQNAFRLHATLDAGLHGLPDAFDAFLHDLEGRAV